MFCCFYGDGFDALETYLFTSPCSEAEFQLFLNNKSYFDWMNYIRKSGNIVAL